MPEQLIRKLENFTRLSPDDKQALRSVCARPPRQFDPGETIISEGDNPKQVNLLLSGWACRTKVLEDGRKQMVGFLIPGDLCDLKIFILGRMDHSITAVSQVAVSQIPHDVVDDLTEGNGRLAKALWWASLVAEAVDREWIVNIGQRSAPERLGHLFCEMFYRLRCVGLTTGKSCHLPLTQAELAETTGMSTVHVNRSLQELRGSGLIVLEHKTLTIPDRSRLEAAVMFTPTSLHLDGEGANLDANAA